MPEGRLLAATGKAKSANVPYALHFPPPLRHPVFGFHELRNTLNSGIATSAGPLTQRKRKFDSIAAVVGTGRGRPYRASDDNSMRPPIAVQSAKMIVTGIAAFQVPVAETAAATSGGPNS